MLSLEKGVLQSTWQSAGKVMIVAGIAANPLSSHAQEAPATPGGGTEQPAAPGNNVVNEAISNSTSEAISNSSATATVESGSSLGSFLGGVVTGFFLGGSSSLQVGDPQMVEQGCVFGYVSQEGFGVLKGIFQQIDTVKGTIESAACSQHEKQMKLIDIAGQMAVQNGDTSLLEKFVNDQRLASETFNVSAKIYNVMANWHYKEYGVAPGEKVHPDEKFASTDVSSHMHVLDAVVNGGNRDALSDKEQRLYDKFEEVLTQDDYKLLRHLDALAEDRVMTTEHNGEKVDMILPPERPEGKIGQPTSLFPPEKSPEPR